MTRRILKRLLHNEKLEELSVARLSELILVDDGISESLPDGTCRIDPRNGDRILFNSSRSRRPHDNVDLDSRSALSPAAGKGECIICLGQTTTIIDVADLSEGFTFINENLFPLIHPAPAEPEPWPPVEPRPPVSSPNPEDGNTNTKEESSPAGRRAWGLHLLQWTSSLHDRDWHNMPASDRIVVMRRLAVLEKKLLTDQDTMSVPPCPGGRRKNQLHGKVPGAMNERDSGGRSDGKSGRRSGGRFVSIIKNYGSPVGGSLEHGHQQVVLSNIMPRRFSDNLRFKSKYGICFSSYLLENNPPHLLLKDYGPATLLIPYFMKRPYDMILIVKDAGKEYLHELDGDEIHALSEGWHDATRTMLTLLAGIGRTPAYTILANNGPGAGIYFEFLPYTQEMGGYEQLGLYACQENPGRAAERLKLILQGEAKYEIKK